MDRIDREQWHKSSYSGSNGGDGDAIASATPDVASHGADGVTFACSGRASFHGRTLRLGTGAAAP
jgi:hypothetical protein